VLSVGALYAGRHAARRRGRRWIILAVILALVASFIAGVASAAASPPAPSVRLSLSSSSETLGQRILDKAETRAGAWYLWGGSGPYVFDCSGLVYWSAKQLGISVPRTTGSMLAGSAHLYRIPLSWARRGDLMFYGSGHVEIDTIWYHQTFGAQEPGTRVGWHQWSGWWHPTMAMRFR
jgi:cell wall-associated NlpC family hydrolase